MKTYTIGFTRKNAERFFTLLRNAKVKTLVDVRLNNVSQLSGFAKRDDLQYFLKELCQADYLHLPDLAPTREMLKAYKQEGMSWRDYEDAFLNLMTKRNVERLFAPETLEDACLLCSEHLPHHCHRRLVAEYLNMHWSSRLNVEHLY